MYHGNSPVEVTPNPEEETREVIGGGQFQVYHEITNLGVNLISIVFFFALHGTSPFPRVKNR